MQLVLMDILLSLLFSDCTNQGMRTPFTWCLHVYLVDKLTELGVLVLSMQTFVILKNISKLLEVVPTYTASNKFLCSPVNTVLLKS